MSLTSFFPADQTARVNQLITLKKIESAFQSGKKFIILNAPTGSGKSYIAKTIASSSKDIPIELKNAVDDMVLFSEGYKHTSSIPSDYRKFLELDHGGAFVLTITKNLQNQYKSLFSDASCLKGKSNYTCLLDTTKTPENAECIRNPSLLKRCEHNKICPFINTRNNSITNKFSILNYKMFSNLPKHVRYREHIICDEASELPNELASMYSLTIPNKILFEFGYSSINKIPIKNNSKFLGWLNEFSDCLLSEVNSLVKKFLKKLSDNSVIFKKIEIYRKLINEIELAISVWDKTEYVISYDNRQIKLVPFKVDKLSSTIFDYADKIILMSATIIDHRHFANILGIKDYEYIEVESEFDPKKAPIITISKNRTLSKNNLKIHLPKIAEEIKNICKFHKNDKGIIHTHNHEITEYLFHNIKGNRFLFRRDENENDVILKEHYNNPNPTVLVSPSLSYGVDLKGNLAKFQIIVKAAFAPLDDPRILKIFNDDKQWYINQMLNTLIQSCGRGVRSKDDECVTYILDGCIPMNVIQNKDILPKYFLERFV